MVSFWDAAGGAIPPRSRAARDSKFVCSVCVYPADVLQPAVIPVLLHTFLHTSCLHFFDPLHPPFRFQKDAEIADLRAMLAPKSGTVESIKDQRYLEALKKVRFPFRPPQETQWHLLSLFSVA